ncbi:MAG: hypothetical protein ABFD50_19830, partial [Smithella sp.]
RLPWGGLIHTAIVRNKDDDLMGFFQDASTEQPQTAGFKQPLQNGWCLWTEKQHGFDLAQSVDRFFITLVWNPFFNKEGQVVNALDHTIMSREERIPYFYNLLQEIERIFQKRADIRLLTNESVLSYLRSTLTTSRPVPQAPVPLYLDALLSQNLRFVMREDDLEIDGKTIGIITPLGYPEPGALQTLFAQYEAFPYRFVRRFLFCDEHTFQKEQNRYMSRWCSGRKSMLHFLKSRIQGQLSGYDTSSFLFFHDNATKLQQTLADAEAVMRQLEIPSILERFNLKDIFWGSLPGIFRANLVPPVSKADNWDEFFYCDLLTEVKNV